MSYPRLFMSEDVLVGHILQTPSGFMSRLARDGVFRFQLPTQFGMVEPEDMAMPATVPVRYVTVATKPGRRSFHEADLYITGATPEELEQMGIIIIPSISFIRMMMEKRA